MSRARDLRVGVVRADAVWWGEGVDYAVVVEEEAGGEANCTWIVPAWPSSKGEMQCGDRLHRSSHSGLKSSVSTLPARCRRACTVFVPLLGPRRVRHAPRSRFGHETFPIRRLDYCHYTMCLQPTLFTRASMPGLKVCRGTRCRRG